MITERAFRRLALALEGAIEVPHMDRRAFRTRRRIFATIAADGRSANLMLDPLEQELVVKAHPTAFVPVPGGWGAMGATTVLFAAVDAVVLADVLASAHARAMPARKTARPPPRRRG